MLWWLLRWQLCWNPPVVWPAPGVGKDLGVGCESVGGMLHAARQTVGLAANRPKRSNPKVLSFFLAPSLMLPKGCPRQTIFMPRAWLGADLRVWRPAVTPVWPWGWPTDQPAKPIYTQAQASQNGFRGALPKRFLDQTGKHVFQKQIIIIRPIYVFQQKGCLKF